MTTEVGTVELRVPPDRNSSFAPVAVRKGQRWLDGPTGNVISLYAKGMTTGDIQAHLAEIYGTAISRDDHQPDHRRQLFFVPVELDDGYWCDGGIVDISRPPHARHRTCP